MMALQVAGTGQWRAYTEDPRTTTSRILIVDDDPAAARAVDRMVAAEGWSGVIAPTWTDAVRLFQDENIDLVIVDALMPTVDGFKLTQLLRARSSSYVPILMLTSLSDDTSREHALSVGVDDILSKPSSPLELRLRIGALLRIRHLTSALEAKTRELEAMAHRDALPGLANRRSLDERLRVELARAQRYGRPLGLVMLDIDRFKRVNDEHGHQVGDRLLEFVGELLSGAVRPSDLACRYGGEEFVVVVSDTTAGNAVVLAQRLRRGFEAQTSTLTPAGSQTISAGVSGTDLLGDAVSAELLLHTADVALYAAKNAGRNRVCCWGPELAKTGTTP
jgi:two-component system, cell cycle response regulator